MRVVHEKLKLFARSAQNENYNTGAASAGALISTANRAPGAAVNAPSGTSSKTTNSITLIPVTPPANGQAVQYAISTTTTPPSDPYWQTSTTFTGLTSQTTYYFFARSVQNDDYNTGAASAGALISTANRAPGAAVSAPSGTSSVTINSITLIPVTPTPANGQTVEYARSDSPTPAPTTGWQSSTAFTGLSVGTTYYFFARSAQNNDYNAGAVSAGYEVSTLTPVITITKQPAATTDVLAGSISGSLSVAASVTPALTLTYQWYSNTTDSNSGGTLLSGATSTSYTIPTSLTMGTYYYYCVVSSAGGGTAVSNVATVIVSQLYSWYGDGSAMVFYINSARELTEFANIVNGTTGGTPAQFNFLNKTINLSADIPLTGTWTPIGNQNTANQFRGTFNGNGKQITGLVVSGSANYMGLFGYIGVNGRVENLNVSGTVSGGQYVGGIAGYINGGTVTSCSFTGSVSGTSNIGGIAGYSSGSVTNSSNTGGTVEGSSSNVGGVVGDNIGTVARCYNANAVYGSNNVGGVVGQLSGLSSSSPASVTNCYNTGNVSGTSSGATAGGVAGQQGSYATVSYCYNTGNVSGFSSGGIVGQAANSTTTISNSVSLGQTVLGGTSTSYIGRIAGSTNGTFTNNKARSNMLIGANGLEAMVSDSDTNGTGVALGTAQSSVFNSADGWDTSTVWNPISGSLIAGATLPTLRDMPSHNPTLPASP